MEQRSEADGNLCWNGTSAAAVVSHVSRHPGAQAPFWSMATA